MNEYLDQPMFYGILTAAIVVVIVIKVLLRKQKRTLIKLELLYDLSEDKTTCSIDILEKLVDAPLKIFDELFTSRVKDFLGKFLESGGNGELINLSNYIGVLYKKHSYLLGLLISAAAKLPINRLAEIYVDALQKEYLSRNKDFRTTMDFIGWVIHENHSHDKIIKELHNISIREQKLPELPKLILAEIIKIEKSKEWVDADVA